MKTFIAYLTLTLLACVYVWGQTVVPGPAAVVPIAGGIDALTAWIQGHVVASLASIGFVVELLLRYVPSDKPRSLLLGVSAVVHSLGKMLDAVSQVLDGLLQNVNKPK